MGESANQQIGDRLRLFRESKRLSQAQLADAVGGTTRGVQNTELNVSLPNSKLLIRLRELGLNIDWLLTGEGQMLRDAASANGGGDVKAYGDCVEILELALNKLNRTLSPEKKRVALDSMYRAWERDQAVDSQLLDMIIQLAA